MLKEYPRDPEFYRSDGRVILLVPVKISHVQRQRGASIEKYDWR